MKTKLTAIIFFTLFLNLLPHPADAVTLKIATLSPDGSMWMQKMREGAKEVAEKTANRVEIKYYPGGVMGDDKAVLRKIRIGQLQGGAVVTGSMSQFFPDVQIYCLPMKFQSFEEVDYVRQQMDPILIAGLEKVGFIAFGIAEGGFAYIMSANVPIRFISDLRKNKVWIPDNDAIALEAVKSFDITPIPLSIADVRTGLQTGLINTVATPPIGAVALQWHTQVKYLTDIPFLYIYAVLTVDKKAFEQILPEDQKAVREILGRVFREIDRQNREDNVKALETLRNQGIEFIKPPEDAMKEWHERTASLPKLLLENGRLSQEMVNTLEKNIEAYRSGSKIETR